MHKKTHRRRGDRRGATAWRRVGAGPGSGRGVKGAQLRTWTHDLRRRGLAPGRDGRGRRRHRDASMRRARAAGATGGGRTDPVVQGRGQTGRARRGAVGRTGAGRACLYSAQCRPPRRAGAAPATSLTNEHSTSRGGTAAKQPSPSCAERPHIVQRRPATPRAEHRQPINAAAVQAGAACACMCEGTHPRPADHASRPPPGAPSPVCFLSLRAEYRCELARCKLCTLAGFCAQAPPRCQRAAFSAPLLAALRGGGPVGTVVMRHAHGIPHMSAQHARKGGTGGPGGSAAKQNGGGGGKVGVP